MSRPGSPERPRGTTGTVRRRPRPTRTKYVSQCFSGHFLSHQIATFPRSFPVVTRPTPRLAVDGRVCNAFPNISVDTTRPRGGRPRSFRSSPIGPGEVLRSTAAFATIFRTVQCATRLPSGELSDRLPSDARSSGRLPSSQCSSRHFRIRHAGWPTSNAHVRWREGEDRVVSRRSTGTARAVLRSSRIFRPALHETAAPLTVLVRLAFLGCFLPRPKIGPTNASQPSRPRPHMSYIVG